MRKYEMSARSEVIQENITNLRKHIIFLDLEMEYAAGVLEKFKQVEITEENKELVEKRIKELENALIQNNAVKLDCVERLNFYKSKREERKEKKIKRDMKFYEKCPKTISRDKLVEIKDK